MAAYPRKQTLFIFLACSVAVLGASYYVRGDYFGQNTGPITNSVVVVPISAAVTQNISSNEDWKKQFASVDAAVDSFKPVKTTAAPKPAEKLTATDQLGRIFFTNYAQLSQSGLTEDQNSVDSIMSRAASQSVDTLPPPKIYALDKDVNIVTETLGSLKTYNSSLETVAQEYLNRGDDVAIATRAFETENTSSLVDIDPVIKSYQKMLGVLGSVPVPQPLAETHLDLMNGISVLLYSAKAFRHMDTDPFLGLAATKTEVLGLQYSETAFSTIGSYLSSKGI